MVYFSTLLQYEKLLHRYALCFMKKTHQQQKTPLLTQVHSILMISLEHGTLTLGASCFPVYAIEIIL